MDSKTKRLWLMAPGLAVLMFTIASIVLPVGSDGLGRTIRQDGSLGAATATWARDLHDGFWHRQTAHPTLMRPALRVEQDLHADARELCRKGMAKDAVQLYQRIGIASYADIDALWDLSGWLVTNGEYDLAEWYVREADILLGGGTLRNNLAWHYTQTNQRATQALNLALSSTTAERNACNVDTLAWAYYRNGMVDDARRTALETLTFSTSWLESFGEWEETEAKRSSLELLELLETCP